MVNTRTDAELAAAVQAAVDAMLPQIREQVREEYRTGAVPSGSNPPPVTIHTWLERFNKQKPRSFEKAVAPVDAENWISHMEKIFDVMDCNDAFKTRLAVYKFEGDALAWWKAYKQAKGGDAWVLTLTWAAFKELFFLQFFPRAEQERLKREYHSIRQRASENSTEYMQRFLRLAGFLGQAAGTAEEQAKNFRWGLHKSILDHVMCIQFTDVAQVADAARNLEILRDRDDYDRSERSDKRHKSGDRYQSDTQQNNYQSHDQKNDRQGSDRQGGGGNYRNNNNNNYSRDNNRIPASAGYPLEAWPTSADVQEEHCASSSGHADNRSPYASAVSLHLLKIRAANTSVPSLPIVHRISGRIFRRTSEYAPIRDVQYRSFERGFIRPCIAIGAPVSVCQEKDGSMRLNVSTTALNLFQDGFTICVPSVASERAGHFQDYFSHTICSSSCSLMIFCLPKSKEVHEEHLPDTFYNFTTGEIIVPVFKVRILVEYGELRRITRILAIIQILISSRFSLDDDGILCQGSTKDVPRAQATLLGGGMEARCGLRESRCYLGVVDPLTIGTLSPIRKELPPFVISINFQQEIVRLHGTPISGSLEVIVHFSSETDGTSERTIQTIDDMLRSCALEWEEIGMTINVAVAWKNLEEAQTDQKSLPADIGRAIDSLPIREDLSYTKEPESILDHQDRFMRKKTIPFVKIPLGRNHPSGKLLGRRGVIRTFLSSLFFNDLMILEGSELTKDDRESQLYDEFERFCQIKGETIHAYYVRAAHENGVVLDEEQLLFLTGEQVTNFDDDVFEADQCDAFDSDVDEAPTTQTMFMVNLSSEDPIYDEAGPSYDSNTPFEVQDHDTFVDHMDEYHEVHEMQSDVQHNYVVDSDADYTSDSNIIPYDQYVEDNEEHVVQSNVSSVRNDALMSILDEMHEQGVQSMSTNKQVKVVNDTLTSELARYKELVGVYEQRAKFELTDRERKIDEQMRIIISDRNRKETSLKSELHSAQLQLRST
ncbi:zinc finger, CCHC-type, retrotransposon gag domain protein [Tanacetum coccineum]|uniref:Zinc finger, CCHC-type, retrotransposon gag domain protein n=1 Tax=Tanacetum coccineum TaxID=301880 RepID=A0ABQ5CNF0_9ASTR